MALLVENPPANARGEREVGSIPGSGRSPGGGRGNPLQYSCLGKSTDRGAWWATVHGVAESDTAECTHMHTAQFSSVAQSCPTPCDSVNHSTPGLPVHHQLPEFTQTYVHRVGDAIQPSRPLSSPSPPALNLPQHQGSFPMSQFFASGSQSIGSFSFSISPSSEYSGLISFRMDWLYLLAVQGTLKSLLQHHSSKASILQCSAFLIVQLSHPYITTGKTIALTRWTFVGKVMSLLFNMLSRLVITFLPKSKCLLISWLQSPSTVILEPPKIKSATVCPVSPSICHQVMGPEAMILVF